MKQGLISICFLFAIQLCEAQKQDSLLLKAYKSKSLPELEKFFENWAIETPALSKEEFSELNKTGKNIYLVFQSFYNPLDISRTGGSEWGNDIYKGTKYFLVQGEINYTIVDTLLKDPLNKAITFDRINYQRTDKYDTLKNFRPQLSFSNIKCLTLTESRNKILNRFLGNKYYKLGTGNIMSPARSKGESEKRKKFLDNYIKIWYGHWGGYWQLYSYPYVSGITFDRNFQNAIIEYAMIYEGGYAYFRNVDGKWMLIKAERTWIE